MLFSGGGGYLGNATGLDIGIGTGYVEILFWMALNCFFSSEPVDGPAPLGARPLAGTELTKFGTVLGHQQAQNWPNSGRCWTISRHRADQIQGGAGPSAGTELTKFRDVLDHQQAQSWPNSGRCWTISRHRADQVQGGAGPSAGTELTKFREVLDHQQAQSWPNSGRCWTISRHRADQIQGGAGPSAGTELTKFREVLDHQQAQSWPNSGRCWTISRHRADQIQGCAGPSAGTELTKFGCCLYKASGIGNYKCWTQISEGSGSIVRLFWSLFTVRSLFQYPIRRLIVIYRKVPMPPDLYSELFDRFEIWQAHR